MKVILLEDIKSLGKKYEVKELKDGYVRNFLLPRKLVEVATDVVLKRLAAEKAAWEEVRRRRIAGLQEKANQLEGITLEFKLKIGTKGEVFGSITPRDIEEALEDKGFRRAKAKLDRPIKSLGERKVEIDFGEGVKAFAKVVIL